jgi:uncharacterized OsmC-like protein
MMGVHTYKAASVLKETGMMVESDVRGFKVIADEPKALGGTNMGISPVESLLCALGACQCMTARFFAMLLKIDLTQYHVDIEGDVDARGFLNADSGIRPGFQEIRLTVHVKANAPPENIAELLALVESRCPVGETVFNGVPVVVRHIQ